MIPVDLLIFDLDGTLADTKQDIAMAVNLTLKEFGLPPKEPALIYGYVGDGVRKLLQRAFEGQPQAFYEKALKIFRQYYLTHLLDTTRFYPGVLEILEHFRGKKKAIATNKPYEYTKKIIDGLGVQDRFDLVLGGDSTLHLKPHPAIIQEVLSRLGVDGKQAVMVGDGVNDILAARAAGAKSCAVGYGLGRVEDLLAVNPDFFCDQIKDLPGIFC
jgi:phosphoglycolate phosphatase